ncbi:MAG: methyltransferase domain-containing protein [Erysipelotrichaceae bacterium]|nr:methyltransferase domain-containing protein [Erysipelotrichaceae bacterium]
MKNDKPETINDSFDRRVEPYDYRMLRDLEGAKQLYSYSAALLPKNEKAKILDLGCGSGEELEHYFNDGGLAEITGIVLSAESLEKLKDRFEGQKLNLICHSFFDWPFGVRKYTAVVSVEVLHHLEPEAKLTLYRKVFSSLKEDGCFVLTDHFADSQQLQDEALRMLEQRRKKENLSAEEFYHFDIPLTVENEMQLLNDAGFKRVDMMRSYGAAFTLMARKRNAFRVEIAGNNRAHGLFRDHFAPGEKVSFTVMTGTDTSYYITSDQVRIETVDYSAGGLSVFCFIMPEMDVTVNIRSENTMTALPPKKEEAAEKRTGRRFCHECGGEIFDDPKFCPNCGARLK